MDEPEEKRQDPHLHILHGTFLVVGVIVFIWLLLAISDDTKIENET